MFQAERILYEDNHLIVVNKLAGELVQPDPNGASALENEIKEFIRIRDHKPGAVFLGVVHRLDRPVSGAVLFAKTSKALVRLNEMMKNREFEKRYWAITEAAPSPQEGMLTHHLARDPKTNKTRAHLRPTAQSKEARLNYRLLGGSKRYYLIEVELLTGRHHQIRAQLSALGCPIRGDLKYGASRSNPGGGISLHSRSLTFLHPVTAKDTPRREIHIVAPTPRPDSLWEFFEQSQADS